MKKKWTDQERNVLRKLYRNSRSQCVSNLLNRSVKQVYQQARFLGLKRLKPPTVYKSGNVSVTCFKKGHIPWNKGMKGLDIGGKDTQFKKGSAPHNYKPVGSERINKYGYIEVKVLDPKKWSLKHRHVWEQENGRIPKDHIVVFKDGNRQNCNLSNLELISRAENMERNTIHNYPEEIKKIIRTLAALTRKINEQKY